MDVSIKEDSLRSEALDVVVQLLFELDEKRELDDFYDRICEAVCLQTSMERARLFLYDSERRLVLPAGSHGVHREIIAHGYGSLEETPIAQRALAEDRVVEISELGSGVPARYRNPPRHHRDAPPAVGRRRRGVGCDLRRRRRGAVRPHGCRALDHAC